MQEETSCLVRERIITRKRYLLRPVHVVVYKKGEREFSSKSSFKHYNKARTDIKTISKRYLFATAEAKRIAIRHIRYQNIN